MCLLLLAARRYFSRSITAAVLILLSAVQLTSGESVSVRVNGTFSEAHRQFDGSALYRLSLPPEGRLLFHLPPNWHVGEDERTEYYLHLSGSAAITVPRKLLTPVLPRNNENQHLPSGILVTRVFINNREVRDFSIRDNRFLPPSLSSKNTILEIPCRNGAWRHEVSVEIRFSSDFRLLPKGYRRFLWDFVPRPIAWIDNTWDFRGSQPQIMKQMLEIRHVRSTAEPVATKVDTLSAPVVFALLDNWDYANRYLRVSADAYLGHHRTFLLSRAKRVVDYLQRFSVLNGRDPLQVVFWDGPLTVSGMSVLVPRRLFRYPEVFYKQFEVTLLHGMVKVLLLRRFDVDERRHPWIIPAIQAEITRNYFGVRFNGNTRLFPWLEWINPEYFSDATVRHWVENLAVKEVCGADLDADNALFPHVYHPGVEKGSHLLWVMHDGAPDYRERLVFKFFELLNQRPDKRERLNSESVFRLFTRTREQREVGELWLSESGRIDYALENVKILGFGNRYQVQLDIRNHGSISPRLVVGLYSDGRRSQVHAIEGAGRVVFFCDWKPDMIILDPDFNLLDDNPVNNRWGGRVQTRLIWDFAPADAWLFTVSPLVGEANTFDQNILGLNMKISYLSRTSIQLNLWKGSSSSLLWTGEFQHVGFPFKGAELYLKSGYLGAVNSTTVGFKHALFRGYPGLSLETALWQEKLDDLENDEFGDDQLDWTGMSVSAEYPLFQKALHLWKMDLTARTGHSLFTPQHEYQQLQVGQILRYSFGMSDLHFSYNHGCSSGVVPLQHQFPMGGTEGLAGFPRRTELLYEERRILGVGATLPPVLDHTDINLLGLMWLSRMVPVLDFRYGQGISDNSAKAEFMDVELSISLEGEFINRFTGAARLGVAQPLGHEKYKDYRLIVFSNWVF